MAGLLLAAVGALLWSGFGKGWLGRLPGDIHYSKGDFSFHFPIVTCLLLSATPDVVALVVPEIEEGFFRTTPCRGTSFLA